MSDKPILFSGEMIRAILDGRKTQTRRAIRPQPGHNQSLISFLYGVALFKHLQWTKAVCPYGEPGDTLWVRETWATIPLYDIMSPSQLVPSGTDLFWRADNSQTRYNKATPGRWRPSIFMPRWASRITLRVESVRVERVQDITTQDIYAEGAISDEWLDWRDDAQTIGLPPGACIECEMDVFAALWDSIYAKRGFGWSVNPWVFAIEFKKVGAICQ